MIGAVAMLRVYRFPCFIESSGKRVLQEQRVMRFSTPESISAATARLAQIREELGDVLDHPRALTELASLLFFELERPMSSEGIVRLLSDGELTAEDLNHTRSFHKYPSVLEDLGLLAKCLARLPPGYPTLPIGHRVGNCRRKRAWPNGRAKRDFGTRKCTRDAYSSLPDWRGGRENGRKPLRPLGDSARPVAPAKDNRPHSW